jgi:hypothetical protein
VETATIGNGGDHLRRFLVEHTGSAIEPPLIHVCVATFATLVPRDTGADRQSRIGVFFAR